MERILYEAQRQVCLIRIHITWPREDTKFLFECERVKYYLKPEKRNFVSPSGHVMFYLLYKHQLMPFEPCERRDLLCSHSNGDLVRREEIVFFRKSLPGISWVFI